VLDGLDSEGGDPRDRSGRQEACAHHDPAELPDTLAGLTGNAGGCMLATATRDGRHLLVVVLNATLHSTADATVLLNYGFSTQPRLPLLS